MRLKVVRADPSGNITLFVLDPVPREDRPAVAARLMALPGSDVEQVGFLCPPLWGSAGRVEMAGGEFCGNAARSFGMLAAQELGRPSRIQVEVSGCPHPVAVDIGWTSCTARAQMPLPRAVTRAEADGHPGALVDLEGIAHFVVETAPSLEFFEKAEPLFWDIADLDAYGVIFLEGERITPLVKVPAAGTLVWEGSCGSGSLAAAIAQSQAAPDGVFVRTYHQPAGAVEAAVTRQDGRAVAAWIGGRVTLDSPVSVEL